MEMLFIRRREGLTGGHLKVRDYIEHTHASGLYRPVLYLSGEPAPALHDADLFDSLPCRRSPRLRPAEAYFVAGDDWRQLDEAGLDPAGCHVINLVQGFRHLTPGSFLRACLSRPATRICVSNALADAIRPLANGPVQVAPTAIARPPMPARAGGSTDVFIAGLKDPPLARAIAAALGDTVHVDVATAAIPRGEYLARIAQAHVAVLLPLPREGFFLPPLEAMHLGVAAVTCDCLGGRDHCIDGMNCLVVQRDPAALASAARRLLADPVLRSALRAGGAATVACRSLARERDHYRHILQTLAPPWQCPSRPV